MAKNISDDLFGPLPKQYCMLYYVFTIITFISLVISVLAFIYMLVFGKKTFGNMWGVHAGATFYNIIAAGIAYLSMRMIHTMCVRTL